MMKILILVLAVVLIACFFLAGTSYAITWSRDLDTALKHARSMDKKIMVDFYADWCGWCKKLDSDTYSDAKVRELASDFICVKINTDEKPELAKKYGVNGLPTVIFIDSSGKQINRIGGYAPAQQFITVMSKILDASDKPTKKETKPQWPFIQGVDNDQKTKSQAAKVETKSAKGPYDLSGILYSKKDPKAIINDTVVRQGDKVNDASIVEIAKDHVILSKDGKNITLKIEE